MFFVNSFSNSKISFSSWILWVINISTFVMENCLQSFVIVFIHLTPSNFLLMFLISTSITASLVSICLKVIIASSMRSMSFSIAVTRCEVIPHVTPSARKTPTIHMLSLIVNVMLTYQRNDASLCCHSRHLLNRCRWLSKSSTTILISECHVRVACI